MGERKRVKSNNDDRASRLHFDLRMQTIKPDVLVTVSGGVSLSEAWTNTKNFTGGLFGGAVHGVNAKTSQIDTFADTSSRATKAGFELGAMGNMAAGPVGDLVGLGADALNPGK